MPRFKTQKGVFRETRLQAYCKRCEIEYRSDSKVLIDIITNEYHCPICKTGLSAIKNKNVKGEN